MVSKDYIRWIRSKVGHEKIMDEMLAYYADKGCEVKLLAEYRTQEMSGLLRTPASPCPRYLVFFFSA